MTPVEEFIKKFKKKWAGKDIPCSKCNNSNYIILESEHKILKEQRIRHHPEMMTLTEERDRYKTRTEVAETLVKDLYQMIEVTKNILRSDKPPIERVNELIGKENRLSKAQDIYRTIICEKNCTNLNIPCLCPVAKERLDKALVSIESQSKTNMKCPNL